jgi:hypothetical protein
LFFKRNSNPKNIPYLIPATVIWQAVLGLTEVYIIQRKTPSKTKQKVITQIKKTRNTQNVKSNNVCIKNMNV